MFFELSQSTGKSPVQDKTKVRKFGFSRFNQKLGKGGVGISEQSWTVGLGTRRIEPVQPEFLKK